MIHVFWVFLGRWIHFWHNCVFMSNGSHLGFQGYMLFGQFGITEFISDRNFCHLEAFQWQMAGILGFKATTHSWNRLSWKVLWCFLGKLKAAWSIPTMAYSRSPLHIDAILDFCFFCFYIKLAKIRKDQKVTCGFKFRFWLCTRFDRNNDGGIDFSDVMDLSVFQHP